MKRFISVVLKMFFRIPGMLRRIYKTTDPKKSYELLKKICLDIMKSGNVNIVFNGVSNLPSKSGYLITPNHQGRFDPVALICGSDEPLRFVLKKELMKNKIVKKVSERCRFWPMDRGNIRQSLEVILNVAKALKEKDNCVIFPEGTRSKKGNELLDFKGGSFKAATKAKAPIVPVCIEDSYKVFDSNTKGKIVVRVSYLKPLYYENYKDMTTNEIAALVKNMIQKELEKTV